MTYGADGELKTIWGEHSFYTDTSSFGPVLSVVDGVALIGGSSGENSYYPGSVARVSIFAGVSDDDSVRALDADGWP